LEDLTGGKAWIAYEYDCPFSGSPTATRPTAAGDIVRRHRLNQSRRKVNRALDHAEVRHGLDELEELGGMHDRVRLARLEDQLLLDDLRAE
jgi:hypothetical protein